MPASSREERAVQHLSTTCKSSAYKVNSAWIDATHLYETGKAAELGTSSITEICMKIGNGHYICTVVFCYSLTQKQTETKLKLNFFLDKTVLNRPTILQSLAISSACLSERITSFREE